MNDEIAERLQALPPNLPDQPDRFELVRSRVIRRRRNLTIISSVLAAAVIVAGVSVVTAGSSPSRNTDVDAANQSDAPDTQPFPDPPAGEKWVGMNGVVVAVPSGWPVLDSACGDGSPGVVLSGTTSPGANCAYFEDVRVSFISGSNGSSTEREFNKCSTTGWCLATKAFREQRVAIRLETKGTYAADVIDRILNSAMVLPNGWATVPFGAWDDTPKTRTAALQEAGFVVKNSQGVEDVDGPVATEPKSGSLVREGATITLLPLTQEQDPEAQELTVTVVNARGFDRGDLPEGPAVWDAQSQTVVYFPPTTYPACLTQGVASARGSTVNLTLARQDEGCGESLNGAVVKISGLDEAPTELTVTEDDETRTVPVEQDPEPQERTVRVERLDVEPDSFRGSARWDEQSQSVAYVPPTMYSACLVEARASSAQRAVALVLTAAPRTDFCLDDLGVYALVTISGLTEAPTELVVTDDGETRTVPVE